MVKLTQLILHFGDKMNVEQKRYGYGPSKYSFHSFLYHPVVLIEALIT
jgi:hypothetical protein